MANALQALHLAAFRTALRTAATEFTFGAAVFSGVLSTPRPDDPRLSGAPDRALEILAVSADLPSGLRRGHVITADGVGYTLSRDPDPIQASGLASIIVSA